MRRQKELSKITEEAGSLVDYTHQIVNGNLDIQIETSQYEILGCLAGDINQINSTFNEYINEIAHILAHLSAGNMAVSFAKNIGYHGDFLPIRNALHKIRNSLNNSFEEIGQLSLEIDQMCSQVDKGSSMIAQNAADQADLINNLSITIHDITDKTISTAVNAKEASLKIEDIKEETETGRKYMDQMLSSMQKVQNSSNDISHVIELINGIAGQTRLLALNASIEAARAGEAGAGFSVVANEVGILAEQSAEAVRNTTQLITNNINTTKESMDIANKTAKSFHTIQTSIEGITQLCKVIADLSDNQAQSLKETSGIITNISEQVQNNASYAQENCAGASNLNEESTHLKEVLMRYRLRNQASRYEVDTEKEKRMISSLVAKLTGSLSRVSGTNSVDSVLEEEIKTQSDLECLYVIGSNGKQLSHTVMNPDILIEQDESFKPAMPGDDYSAKKYFRQAMKNQGVPFTSLEYISTATGGLCKTISCSYEGSDRQLYVICIDLICRF